jgi:hypothetical protein
MNPKSAKCKKMDQFEFDMISDYENSLWRTDSNRLNDEPPLFANLSRADSNVTGYSCSGLPFKVHLTKREPDNEIRDMFSHMDSQEFNFADCEVKSHSTAADSREPKTTLVDVAIRMVEEAKLMIADFGEISLEEKTFLASLIFIRTGVEVDPGLESLKFVEAVNASLTSLKDKRNDDRLRFIYKRGIKWLLSRTTDYVANKLHKMHNYEQSFIEAYFPHNLDVSKSVMDTSFASRKKFQQLFDLSAKFKQDFLDFANSCLLADYKNSTHLTYSNMFKDFKKMASKGGSVDVKQLKTLYKRLPWKAADVKSTVDQLNRVVRL